MIDTRSIEVEMNRAKREYDTLSHNAEETKRDLDRLKERKRTAEANAKKAKETLERLEAELRKADTDVVAMEKKLREFTDRATDYKTKIDHLKQNLEDTLREIERQSRTR